MVKRKTATAIRFTRARGARAVGKTRNTKNIIIKFMLKGNEKDCICHKPNGRHTRYCDSFRLSEFLKRMDVEKVTLHISPLFFKDK
jgi:hypothetical protein